MTDLPMVLITDILSRLPTRTLLCFRCVSKSWKYLIDDSHFIKLQLQRSSENFTNHALLIRSSYIYSVDFPALDEAIVIDHPLKRESIGTSLLGSCNGLLCLSNGESHGNNGTIIYNPVTKKRREVPASKIEFPKYFTWCERLVYGFGYDETNDDYKLVRIIQFHKGPDVYDSEVKVFSLKANCWRRVRDFPHDYYLSYKRQRGVFVNGCLHWMVTLKPDSDASKLIVAFDFKSEEFKVVLQPKYSLGEVHMNVEVLGKKLCLLINYISIRSEVWVMKDYGVQESWTKLFTVKQKDIIGPFDYVRPIAFSKDGSKVLLEQDGEKFIWFDVHRKRVERVEIRGMPSKPEVEVMAESLVLGSRKTHQKEKRNERERLRNVKVADLPSSYKTKVNSGSLLLPDNVTGEMQQQTPNKTQNLKRKGQRDNSDGFLSKGFNLKL